MTREVICVRTKTPSRRFALNSLTGKSFRIFFGILHPTPDIGSPGDLWLKQSAGHIAIFWKRLRANAITPVWREVGGNGLEIPHPLYPNFILKGGTCHAYLHWCQRPVEYFDELEDDFYQAALEFLSVYGAGSSSRPIDLTLE